MQFGLAVRRRSGDRLHEHQTLWMREARDSRMRLEGAEQEERHLRRAALLELHDQAGSREGSLCEARRSLDRVEVPTMKTTRVPDHRCPVCRAELSAASSIAPDEVPEPGDWTVCIACTVILIFNPEMTVRLPLADEMAALSRPAAAQLAYVQRMVLAATGRSPAHA